MEDTVLQEINERLVALEVVHTRYRGPEGKPGKPGERGEKGEPGKDSTELVTMRAERAAFREELNQFRSELYQLRDELRKERDEELSRFQEIATNEIESLCALRDKIVAQMEVEHN